MNEAELWVDSIFDIVEARSLLRCGNWLLDLAEHIHSRINQSIATDCTTFGHVGLRQLCTKPSNIPYSVGTAWSSFAHRKRGIASGTAHSKMQGASLVGTATHHLKVCVCGVTG